MVLQIDDLMQDWSNSSLQWSYYSLVLSHPNIDLDKRLHINDIWHDSNRILTNNNESDLNQYFNS